MTDDRSFNLLTQPWIPVLASNGRVTEVGLYELFRRSTDLRSIAAEIGTQSVAIHRLAMAILHRALTGWGPEDPLERWGELWAAQELPLDLIDEYLDSWSNRFDLLGSSAPFYQVAELHTASGKTSGLRALIADVPNGHQYFTMRAGKSLSSIPFAEAARWLVHCQNFDTSGIKSGAVGDPRVKGGRGYPIGTSWTGGIGTVFPEGRNLRETLLLNLVLTPHTTHRPRDLPVWERETLGPAPDATRSDGEPFGPVDLLTWQSRRVRLIHNGKSVTDVLVSNGDPLKPQARPTVVEHMTEWRRSEAQAKKLKLALVYMPSKFMPSRSFWRGLESSLPSAQIVPTGKDAPDRRPAEVLTWIQELRAEEFIPEGFPIRIYTVGMTYGTNESVIDEIVDDTLILHIDILTNDVLRTQATDAVREADRAVAALSNLAGNLALASGGEPQGSRDRAREQGFFTLDTPYRRWAARIDPSTDVLAHRIEWRDTVRTMVRASARTLIEAAGASAYVGRTVKINNKETLIDVGVASGWFDSAMAKALPRGSSANTH